MGTADVTFDTSLTINRRSPPPTHTHTHTHNTQTNKQPNKQTNTHTHTHTLSLSLSPPSFCVSPLVLQRASRNSQGIMKWRHVSLHIFLSVRLPELTVTRHELVSNWSSRFLWPYHSLSLLPYHILGLKLLSAIKYCRIFLIRRVEVIRLSQKARKRSCCPSSDLQYRHNYTQLPVQVVNSA
jgi:hypothetical protein